MESNKSSTPSVNANFAATVINRAAEIVAGTVPAAEAGCDAFSALQQAKDEFIAAETLRQKKGRTYAWPLLLKDIGQYIKSREPAFADSRRPPIADWSEATDPVAVAQTLREAALPISRMVAERTRWAAKFDAMSEQESAEYQLMRKAAAFLSQHGLTIHVAWDRESPNDPIDYRATVDGREWGFELTELRIDAEGSHLTVGHPKERKSIRDQLAELAAPLPQAPDGPDVLQKTLNNAVNHGRKASKLGALNGVRYCLVLYNRQFLYAPDWEAITLPDLTVFDAVLVLHQENFPTAQTWQVLRNGFGKTLRSSNANDLGDIIAFRNSNRTRRSDPELVKAALRRLEALELTEDDVRAAIAEVRAERSRQ